MTELAALAGNIYFKKDKKIYLSHETMMKSKIGQGSGN